MLQHNTESYERPRDRPSVLWCRVCVKEYRDLRIIRDGVIMPISNNVENTRCARCNCQGSLVWRYNVGTPGNPKWKPHCGDASCTGLCSDPECVPPPRVAEEQEHSGKGGALLFRAVGLMLAGLGALRVIELLWEYFH